MAEQIDISSLRLLVQQLLSRVAELEQENGSLKTVILQLQQENEILRGRLSKNSQNSHKPPSSDGLKKKPALPRSKKGASGGQPNHEGHTLKAVAKPDAIVLHHAPSCPCCQKVFSSEDVIEINQKRQVFDLPEPRLEVTEHQTGLIFCCGQMHRGTFPAEAAAPVQYGHRLKALVTLLNTEYRMSLEQISRLLGDLYEQPVNESTIINATQKCHDALEPVENAIKEAVLQSPVAYFDETGMRVAAKLHWFHTACTSLVCYLFVHQKRGKEALNDAVSILKDFTGRAVHDCWKSYFDFVNCSHSLCNAHIIRELVALTEKGTKWSEQMRLFLLELYEVSEKGTFALTDREFWEIKYQKICQLADAEEPPPVQGAKGRPKNSKGRNLLNRLVQHQSAVLDFAFVEYIPFTNNQAERDIRHVKVKQKIAMSFRTFHGAQIYARIQSFVITTRKQK